MQLFKIYGQLFINKFGAEDNGMWFETLKDLTPTALEKGMERVRKLSSGSKFCEFPPNCLQFRALCLAFYEDLQLPKAHEAYQEIKSRAYVTNPYWSHDLVKFVAKCLPEDFLKIEQEHVAYAKFKKAYEQVCHLVRQGKEIPKVTAPVMRLKAPDRNIAQHHLKQIKQMLGA